MEKKIPPWHLSPFVAQWFSVVQYVVKATLKIWIGGIVASNMIRGDGFHNLGDIVQALLIIAALLIRRLKPKDYPFQYKEVESVVLAILGSVLIVSGAKIGFDSALGVLAQYSRADHFVREFVSILPQHEAVRIDARWLWPLVWLTGASVAVSLVLSWFQIRAGKYSGEAAVVADGKETRMDAGVEAMTLMGVILVQVFGWQLAEYVLGLVVTGFVVHTGWEIFAQGKDSLLKRSLGTAAEDALKDAVLAIPGVEGVSKLVTFRVGRGLAVCSYTIETMLDVKRHEGLRHALRCAIDGTLKQVEDVRETEIYLMLVEPTVQAQRVAYACVLRNRRYTIVTLTEATHLLICDVVQGDSAESRIAPYAVNGSLAPFAKEKHVETLYCLGSVTGEDAEHFRQLKVNVLQAYATDPGIELGVPLPSV